MVNTLDVVNKASTPIHEDTRLFRSSKTPNGLRGDLGGAAVTTISTDKGGEELVRGILTESLNNCYRNIRRINSSNNDIVKMIRRAKRALCDETGGVIFGDNEALGGFLSQEGRTTNLFGHTGSRGAKYYLFSDTTLIKTEALDCLDREFKSLIDSLTILSGHTASIHQKLAYADYVKNILLVTYHALCFQERFGYELTAKDSRLKRELSQAIEAYINLYYSLLLMQPTDEKGATCSLEKVAEDWSKIIGSFRTNDLFEREWLKYPELDDPIVIANAAVSFVLESSTTDIIIGIESGGTELSYVTKMMYGLIHSSAPRVLLVPVSRYTLQQSALYSGCDSFLPSLEKNIGSTIKDKLVLIVDDNANTGLSISAIADYAAQNGARSVLARVAEFDLHRSIFKHTQWNNPPEHIAHPDVFLRSVGVTPITQGLDSYLPFRQYRKITRLRILQQAASRQISVATAVTNRAQYTYAGIKVCGIHNIVDFGNACAAGVEWFGIHCLYDDCMYKEKVRGLPKLHQLGYRLNIDFIIGPSTGLPLAEVDAIRNMMDQAGKMNMRAKFVFLIDGANNNTIDALFKHVIPADYPLPLFFQLQNLYSEERVRAIKKQLQKYYDHTHIIQTFGSKEEVSILSDINKDSLVDYTLIDYQQKGGTGRAIDWITLRNLLCLSTKKTFIAGGINPRTLDLYPSYLGDVSLDFMIDVESSVELKCKNPLRDDQSCPIIIRKSQEKLTSLADAWQRLQRAKQRR